MKLDKRATTFIGVAVIVAILIAGWFLVISPAMAKQAELNTSLSDTQQQIEDYKVKLAGLQEVKRNIGEYKKQNDELTAKFPGDADIKLLLDDIENAGKRAHISRITQIEAGKPQVITTSGSNSSSASTDSSATQTPSADQSPAADAPAADAPAASGAQANGSNNLAIMNLDITAEGSQKSLQSYATQLTKMPRAFLISEAAVTCENDTKKCTLNVSGSTYLYRNIALPEGK